MYIEQKELDLFRDDKGYLVSFRSDDKIFNGKFGQSLVSFIYPNVIKGFHLHKKQTDFSACIKGNVRYVAIKEDEQGIDITTMIIGESNPVLIKIPPGLWHGYMALDGEAVMMHAMDEIFNSNNEDTERRDPYYFGDLWR
jgi:dTDP-4-dehydrorhamnose 3,5-epimerase